jgi:ABC-type bacteriocin/lantibiotic exporter with double-glycine peptidase domain
MSVAVPQQQSAVDCGPAALEIWLAHRAPTLLQEERTQWYLSQARHEAVAGKRGLSVQQVLDLAEALGIGLRAVRGDGADIEVVLAAIGVPSILYLDAGDAGHFSVLTRILPAPLRRAELHDPTYGRLLLTPEHLASWWSSRVALIEKPVSAPTFSAR